MRSLCTGLLKLSASLEMATLENLLKCEKSSMIVKTLRIDHSDCHFIFRRNVCLIRAIICLLPAQPVNHGDRSCRKRPGSIAGFHLIAA